MHCKFNIIYLKIHSVNFRLEVLLLSYLTVTIALILAMIGIIAKLVCTKPTRMCIRATSITLFFEMC